MSTTKEILNQTAHRPWDLPAGKWQFYQEWNETLFIHWEISFDLLRRLVPEELVLDNFQGRYFVSLVAFSMQKIRPRNLPSLKFVSDFHEINLRTYIDLDGKKGVYFLNIEAEKQLSAFVARKLSGLPYEKAIIKRANGFYSSKNVVKNFRLETEFGISSPILQKTELDLWLTERYCLYLDREKKLFRYDIHHPEWELHNLELKKTEIRYQLDKLTLNSNTPFLSHYSKGVKVLSWKKNTL